MSMCRTDIHSESIAIATNLESNQKLLTDAAQDPAAGKQTCLGKASTLRGPKPWQSNHGSIGRSQLEQAASLLLM